MMHPVWALGFFILANRAVEAQRAWLAKVPQPGIIAGSVARLVPRVVAVAASIGVFFILTLSHSRISHHAIVAVRDLETSANTEYDNRPARHRRLCRDLLYIFREVLYEENGSKDRTSRRTSNGGTHSNLRSEHWHHS
jgi:hypothetical protein